MSDVPERPTSRGWYLVAFGLIGSALAIALTGLSQMREVVATMPRHPMPGQHEVALAGGRATLYYEHLSTFDNKDYATAPDLVFLCALERPDGKAQPLARPIKQVSYDSGPYTGRAIYETDIVAPGAYKLTCDGRGPYMIASGGGIGAWFVVAVAGAIPGLAGLIVIAIVALKRRSWHKREAAASA